MLSAFGSCHHGIPSLLRGAMLAAFQQDVVPASVNALGAWTSLRCATKKAGGTAKQCGHAQPKHLGMKISSGELVFPGMIILRQRGTEFHPGENVGMGRDHTIFSTNIGIVRISTSTAPSGKERRFISVEPLPEVVAAAASRAQAASPANVTAEIKKQEELIEQELVQRRAQVKRAMLNGGKPLEPALFFNLPQYNGRMSWLERTEVPRAAGAQPQPMAK